MDERENFRTAASITFAAVSEETSKLESCGALRSSKSSRSGISAKKNFFLKDKLKKFAVFSKLFAKSRGEVLRESFFAKINLGS